MTRILTASFALVLSLLLAVTSVSAFEPLGASRATLERVAVGKLRSVTLSSLAFVKAIRFVRAENAEAVRTRAEALGVQCKTFIDEAGSTARYFSAALPEEIRDLYLALIWQFEQKLLALHQATEENRGQVFDEFLAFYQERLELLWSSILHHSEERGL